MRILITGGAGFIGQHLARRLASHDLIAVDTLNPQVHVDPESSRARFPGDVVVADVAEQSTWDSLPVPDAVVHLAADTGTAQSMYEIERYRHNNVDGTRLAAASAARWDVPLVSLSSRAVYGEGAYVTSDGRRIVGEVVPDAVPSDSRETDAHAPVSVYGQTKSEAEPFVLALPGATVIRPQNVIGYGQALHNPYTGVLAAFLAMLREGRPLTVYGDGSATRDFVHVSDLTAMIEWALLHPAEQSRVVNCGTGVRMTLNELAQAAVAGAPELIGEAGTIVHVDVHRAGDIEHACADMTHAADLGAPRAQVSSADAVADFIRRSWNEEGAPASAWDAALDELSSRGLTS